MSLYQKNKVIKTLFYFIYHQIEIILNQKENSPINETIFAYLMLFKNRLLTSSQNNSAI